MCWEVIGERIAGTDNPKKKAEFQKWGGLPPPFFRIVKFIGALLTAFALLIVVHPGCEGPFTIPAKIVVCSWEYPSLSLYQECCAHI